MKKIFLILFLVSIAILFSVFILFPENKSVKNDIIWGTYLGGPYPVNNKIKNDSNFIQEDLSLSEDKKATCRKSELYALKNIRRTGIWNFKNDTLTITYQTEWLEFVEKKATSTGGFTYLKKDTIITRTEPFSIKYLVEKKAFETRICPLDTGQCFDKYLLNHIE